MFNSKEKKSLQLLLSRVVNPEEAFSPEGIHGFLSGIISMPEIVMPSEWMPVAFGEDMFEFVGDDDPSALMGSMMEIYNRINNDRLSGKLRFPFNMAALKDNDLQRMRDWTEGFYTALLLRHETWEMEGDLTEEEQDVSTSLAVIASIARPDHMTELFEIDPDHPDGKIDLEGKLFSMLPLAVKTIQDYSEKLMAKGTSSSIGPDTTFPKISRNDPCPCNSGKKYKKCCGMN